MGENTRLIYDIMYCITINKMTGLLMLVDFEKAFDSVEWSFIENVLIGFNFGNNIINAFKMLYRESEIHIYLLSWQKYMLRPSAEIRIFME